MGKSDLVFGGKVLVLAGDFRQCLTVVPGASRAGIVSQCINKSKLWSHFKILRLTENMRVRASGDPDLEAFDRWTLSIGNGDKRDGLVSIPDEMVKAEGAKKNQVKKCAPNNLLRGRKMVPLEEYIPLH